MTEKFEYTYKAEAAAAGKPFLIKNFIVILGLLWSVPFAALIVLDIYDDSKWVRNIAIAEARAIFNKDQAFRFWATSHGGIYVTADRDTPPNPYLKHIPDRDFRTPSGALLTLMNPEYMMRQMNEQFSDMAGSVGHVTSLKPLRPENTPDRWERAALLDFERNVPEVLSFTNMGGKPYLRLMRPMVAKKNCLKCHAAQGYREGDIRGGFSVSMPLSNLYAHHSSNIFIILLTHLSIWLAGMGGILFWSYRIGREIQARLKAEEQVIAKEQYYRSLLYNIHEDILVIGPDFRITDTNSDRLISTGQSREDIIGRHCYEVSHGYACPCGDAGEECFLRDVFKTGEPATYHHVHTRTDGTRAIVDVLLSPLKDESGATVLVIESVRDISEFVDTAEALRDSEERHRALVNATPDIVFVADRDGMLSYINRQPLGFPPSPVGLRQEDLFPPDTAATHRTFIRQVFDTGELITHEEDIELAGTGMQIENRLIPLRGADGSITAVMGIVRDISDRKKAEEAVQASLREKDMLLKEIHHRVKNNMQIIMSLLRMKSSRVTDPETLQLFLDSQSRIYTMALIHERLYRTEDFAKIDFNEYINSLVGEIFLMYGVDRSRIGYRVDIQGVFLGIDRAIPFALVINEMLTNSIKHAFPDDTARDGFITITMNAAGGFIEADIGDNGIGILDSFDYRHTDSTGLTLVHMIVEKQLHGSIRLSREAGTRFTIRIPEDRPSGKK